MMAKIVYAPRSFDALAQEPAQADAFIKDIRLREKQEVRMFWTPKSGTPESFCTDEDSEIAAYFNRIS